MSWCTCYVSPAQIIFLTILLYLKYTLLYILLTMFFFDKLSLNLLCPFCLMCVFNADQGFKWLKVRRRVFTTRGINSGSVLTYRSFGFVTTICLGALHQLHNPMMTVSYYTDDILAVTLSWYYHFENWLVRWEGKMGNHSSLHGKKCKLKPEDVEDLIQQTYCKYVHAMVDGLGLSTMIIWACLL